LLRWTGTERPFARQLRSNGKALDAIALGSFGKRQKEGIGPHSRKAHAALYALPRTSRASANPASEVDYSFVSRVSHQKTDASFRLDQTHGMGRSNGVTKFFGRLAFAGQRQCVFEWVNPSYERR